MFTLIVLDHIYIYIYMIMLWKTCLEVEMET